MKSPIFITFLGTGTSQGIPVIGSDHPVCLSKNPKDKRLRVSVLLQWDDFNYVIDCGPDFRTQMLLNNIKHLDAVLLTHDHSDHTAGIDDIRPFCFRQGGDVTFYAEQNVYNALYKRFEYIFVTENKYPGAPTIKEELIENLTPFNIGGKKVTPIRAMHNVLPVLGYRVGGFTYLTDVKTISDSEIEKIKGTKVLVVNALREEPHVSHLTLSEALELIEIVKPEKAYLTHISHWLGFHDEVEARLPENVHLAYDGLKIEV
ncbi:metal-dependent hydrolase [unidentified eubacterium SCB49]|nr:metal-dependent hydrolase [unidentified eubacterium SCB49]